MDYTKSNNTYFATPKANPKDKIDIEIGDSKQPDKFYPQFKIMRWDNEVNFSARLVQNEKNPIVLKEGKKIKWQGEKIEAHFYNLGVSSEHPDDAEELEIILKEKPATNKIEFTLQTKGLDFFYQPPLTDECKVGDINGRILLVTETDAFDKDGNSVIHRPENIVGSYAVYASENKINYTGGKEYKCGIVGHIYRPKIIDAEGKEVWGELKIDTEKLILSVTIPQEFLDKAVYPVRHAAGLLFGYDTAGSSSDTTNNRIWGGLYTLSETGVVSKMSWFPPFGDSTRKDKMAIYNSDKSLNSVTQERVGNTGAAWNDISFASGVSLNAGNYYLTHLGDINGVKYTSSGGTSFTLSSSYPTFPNPFTGESSGSFRLSIYCTYTTVAAGPAKLKTWNGLEVAKIKTINGLEIAKVKTINGLV